MKKADAGFKMARLSSAFSRFKSLESRGLFGRYPGTRTIVDLGRWTHLRTV